MPRRIDPSPGSGDSLLFLSLAWGGGRAGTLADLIGLVDWIDRSIPTAAELDGGLNRLIAAGFVEAHGAGFRVPAAVLRRFHAFRRRRRKDRFTTAETFVQAAGPPESVPRRVTIRAADWERAYREYCRTFREAWEGMT